MTVYGEELAYIQAKSTGHGSKAAAGLFKILGGAGIHDGLIVDLGCGDGLWCKKLIESGYQTLGIDYSEALIAMARKNVPEAEFEVGSFLSASLPECRAITALGEVFNYCFDPRNSWTALVEFLKDIFEVLTSGGVLIFDLAEPGRCPEPRQLFYGGEDWMVLADIVEDPSSETLTRKITTFRKVNDLYRRSDEVHKLQLYHREKLCEALQAIGFKPQVIDGYGDFTFPHTGYFGIVALKP